MAKYLLTRKAVNDLSDIWNYTVHKWSEKQADQYYQALITGFEELCKNPKLGKPYPEVHPDLFGASINRHIVFYRIVSNTEIEITRVLHQRMDLKKRMEE